MSGFLDENLFGVEIRLNNPKDMDEGHINIYCEKRVMALK
jgi:hypothetical protein